MDAFIVAGFRTGVGKAKKGGFRFTRPDDLAADVIKHLVKSVPGLENKMVDDLFVGNGIDCLDDDENAGQQHHAAFKPCR